MIYCHRLVIIIVVTITFIVISKLMAKQVYFLTLRSQWFGEWMLGCLPSVTGEQFMTFQRNVFLRL